MRNDDDADDDDAPVLTDEQVRDIVSPHSLLLLQCEVPHFVNVRLARAAKDLGIPVIVDVRGEDRRMGRDLLECCDYLVSIGIELDRLARSYGDDDDDAGGEEDERNNLGMTRQQTEKIQARIGPSLRLPSVLKPSEERVERRPRHARLPRIAPGDEEKQTNNHRLPLLPRPLALPRGLLPGGIRRGAVGAPWRRWRRRRRRRRRG